MENFCSEPKWLERLSGHYKTGQPMPKDMVDALIKNRQFLSGMAMLRQVIIIFKTKNKYIYL